MKNQDELFWHGLNVPKDKKSCFNCKHLNQDYEGGSRDYFCTSGSTFFDYDGDFDPRSSADECDFFEHSKDGHAL